MHSLRETPWNTRAIGMPTFEITEVGEKALGRIVPRLEPGHYTVRVDPQSSKRALHELGFYYCDTALTYFCRPDMLMDFSRADVTLVRTAPREELIAIADASFAHGHFHRDFNVDGARADERFNRWVEDIHGSGDYYALMHEGAVAGFFAYSGDAIILQVNAERVRGKGFGQSLLDVVLPGEVRRRSRSADEVPSQRATSRSRICTSPWVFGCGRPRTFTICG